MRQAGVVTYLFGDHLGSTSVAFNDAANSIQRQGYRPFGEKRYPADPTNPLPTDYQYTGQRGDSYINLYWYGSRWYDPALGRFISPDSIVPDTYNPLAYDRYAYSSNNPINYTDPTGHWPELASFGLFFTGLAFEFTRTSNWTGALVSPEVAESLGPSAGETDAMLAGRVVGDILTIVIGVVEVAGGVTIAGGGAVAGCGATLCLASAPAIAAGAAVISYGAGTTLSGAAALGENLGRMYSNRSKNDLKPDPSATGPHSTFKRDPITGKVTSYETYQPQQNPKNPTPWQKILRYDGAGKAHPDTVTKQPLLPHVHDFLNDIVRRPFSIEIPN